MTTNTMTNNTMTNTMTNQPCKCRKHGVPDKHGVVTAVAWACWTDEEKTKALEKTVAAYRELLAAPETEKAAANEKVAAAERDLAVARNHVEEAAGKKAAAKAAYKEEKDAREAAAAALKEAAATQMEDDEEATSAAETQVAEEEAATLVEYHGWPKVLTIGRRRSEGQTEYMYIGLGRNLQRNPCVCYECDCGAKLHMPIDAVSSPSKVRDDHEKNSKKHKDHEERARA